MEKSTCCVGGSRDDIAPQGSIDPHDLTGIDDVEPLKFVSVPGGIVRMGTDEPVHVGDGEEAFTTFVDQFEISTTAVSNAHFAAFVLDCGYVTDSERFGWSYVFQFLLPVEAEQYQAVVGAEWWRVVPGAFWARPEGPESDLADRWDHPVVHVSWNDALAYCRWAGCRLPSEAEWERAVQDNLPTVYPWGDDLEPSGRHVTNVFQGSFPDGGEAEDGFLSTAPVRAFEPYGVGVYNAIGNVWEWTQEWMDPATRSATEGQERMMKGGSYLCHRSYCQRYRAAARMGSTPDSSSGNVGFRVAR